MTTRNLMIDLARSVVPHPALRHESMQLIIADRQLQERDLDPSENADWDGMDLCLAPPFPLFCVEARSTIRKVSFGVIYSVFDYLEPETHEVAKQLSEAILKRVPDDLHWVLAFEGFMGGDDVDMGIGKDSIFFPPVIGYLPLNDEGKLIGSFNEIAYMQSLLDPQPMGDALLREMIDWTAGIYPFSLLALNYLNMTNVRLEEQTVPPAVVKTRTKKHGTQAMPNFHELIVSKSGANLSTPIPREQLSKDRREHVVRGHIKNRATGRFYWNAHIRGKASQGKIEKNYKLK